MIARATFAGLTLFLAAHAMADTQPVIRDGDNPVSGGDARTPGNFSYFTQNWGLDLTSRNLRQNSDGMALAYAQPALRMVDGRLLRIGGSPFLSRAPLSPGRQATWGDMTLGASRYWSLGSEDDPYTLDMRASVRVPAGSPSAGFAAARSDWGLSTVIGKGFGDFSTSLSTAYTMTGRVDGVQGNDVWSADVYLGYVATDTTSFALDYAWSQQPFSLAPSARALGLSASFKMSKLWRLTFSAAHGYSAQEPQRDLNATFTYRFD